MSWSIDCNLSQRYGWNVMKFYMNSDADRKSDGMSYYNPMCAAFPTEVSLHLKVSHQLSFLGLLHGAQHRSCRRWTVSQWPLHSHTGACLTTLPVISAYSVQNIINEKIYLVLWFWYAFLVPVSFTFFFYRGFTILVYELRFNLLYKTVDLQLCIP